MTIEGRINLVVFATVLSLTAIGVSVSYAVFGIIGYIDLKSLTTSSAIDEKTGGPRTLLLLSSMFMLAIASIVLLLSITYIGGWMFRSANFYGEVENSSSESSDETISIEEEMSTNTAPGV